MERIIFTFLIGVLLFFLGAIIHRNSNILGVNNIEGNSKDRAVFVRNITFPMMFLGVWGMSMSFMAVVFSWFIGYYVIVAIGILLPASVLVLNRRFLKGVSTLLFGLIILFVISISAGIIYSERETVLTIDKKNLNVSSIYGMTVGMDEIANVSLLNSLPVIKSRINAYARQDIKKGYFRLKDWGETKLYLHSNEPPFLVVDVKESYRIVFNSKERGKIESYYKQLKEVLER